MRPRAVTAACCTAADHSHQGSRQLRFPSPGVKSPTFRTPGLCHCGLVPKTSARISRPREAAAYRLRSLAVLELLNIPLQAWLWFGVIDLPVTAANTAGFAAFALLLMVGATYWALKLWQLRRRRSRLPGRRTFTVARLLLPVALAVVLGACTAAVMRAPGARSWPGWLFGAFAVLEYVNYFHVQLMHDTRADLHRLFTVGFRRAHLARDLRAARAARPAAP